MISKRGAEFRCYMNLMALDSLPQSSSGPRGAAFPETLAAIRAAGYDGVQFASRATPEQLTECRAQRMGMAASGRINDPREALPLAEQMAADGYECVTVHVGWGLEDDTDAAGLIESILDASVRARFPIYIETHRATIFQDMWRTVGFLKRFPEVRINGDFSHWYTGQEMVYGGFEKKLAFIRPVLERVRFLHGRIGSPGCIQVRVELDEREEPVYVRHFRQLWSACFRAFLEAAQPRERVYFAPELLAPQIFYARTFASSQGIPVEESDRWEQSLVLKRIAEASFEEASSSYE